MISHRCRLLFALFVIPGLIQLSGGHWILLQTVAWGRMLVEYSKNSSLKEAVVKTFDGQHPCGMCKTIRKESGQKKQDDSNASPLKREFFVELTLEGIAPECREHVFAAFDICWEGLGLSPPVPPPRMAMS